ncbi:SDR family oxidoreductase [bacterium]|nr:SDR family oxidoreductase [bacterium]
MSRQTFRNKWIWITGASSGIGRALTLEFAKKGSNLIVSSRKEKDLNVVAHECERHGVQVLVQVIDLANSESIQHAFQTIKSKAIEVDVLINNGGMSQRGLVRDTILPVHQQLMQVNYLGAVELTGLVLPGMIKRQKGHIVGVSSIVGKFGFPLRSSYSASKHALKGYLETLYLEENNNGIDVSIVYPGRIQTEISKHAIDGSGNSHQKMDEGLQNGMDVSDCAKKIVRGLEKKRIEIFVGKRELLLLAIRRFTPSIFFKIAKNIKPV